MVSSFTDALFYEMLLVRGYDEQSARDLVEETSDEANEVRKEREGYPMNIFIKEFLDE